MLDLTLSEQHSTFVQKLKVQVKRRIEHLQKELEGAKDQDETNRLRGRLAELRAIISEIEEVHAEREPLMSF